MCIERVKEEQLQIEKSLQEVYANYRRLLEPLNHITVAQLLLVSGLYYSFFLRVAKTIVANN